ncbi:hypothetical protein ACEPAH_3752 [Sanghuangporus vaninii]
MTRAESCTVVVPSKRKRRSSLVLHLSGGSTTCEPDNDTVSKFMLSESPIATSSKAKLPTVPIIVNGKLVADDGKRYQCTFPGCIKAYRKPVRLEEHERTHTGERPFICLECQKTYFRETHLQAHMRSHLPDSSRPFVCCYEGCEKKFWTSQHLRRHQDLHSGEKQFKCAESGCNQSFSKHNQLRSHFASAHCPTGTKTFRCEHDGCSKSFPTGQKLKAHIKTHEERRYTCSHVACVQKEPQEYFLNWTALQLHSRIVHPPTCPYASCNGKTFTQQKGLRAHLKLHDQREIEEALTNTGDADDEGDDRPVKKRRGGEVGRDWKCSEEGCDKDFKSKNALETHIKVTHLRRRDFVCSVEGCGAQFGYKHLLQRHMARVHEHASMVHLEMDLPAESSSASASVSKPDADPIDLLTGKAYEDRAKKRLATHKNALVCPYPDMDTSSLLSTNSTTSRLLGDQTSSQPRGSCGFVFSRAYDLRRHLSSAHDLEVDREEVVALIEAMRRGDWKSGT